MHFSRAAVLCVQSAVASIFFKSTLAAGSVCSGGFYKELLILSAYPPVESYCSQHYLVAPTVVTAPASTVTFTSIVTVISTVTSPAGAKNKRHKHTTSTTSNTISASSSTTTSANALQSLWSVLEKDAAAIVSTLCSCIEVAKTVTVQLSHQVAWKSAELR